jgi:hypothetical protein
MEAYRYTPTQADVEEELATVARLMAEAWAVHNTAAAQCSAKGKCPSLGALRLISQLQARRMALKQLSTKPESKSGAKPKTTQGPPTGLVATQPAAMPLPPNPGLAAKPRSIDVDSVIAHAEQKKKQMEKAVAHISQQAKQLGRFEAVSVLKVAHKRIQ